MTYIPFGIEHDHLATLSSSGYDLIVFRVLREPESVSVSAADTNKSYADSQPPATSHQPSISPRSPCGGLSQMRGCRAPRGGDSGTGPFGACDSVAGECEWRTHVDVQARSTQGSGAKAPHLLGDTA